MKWGKKPRKYGRIPSHKTDAESIKYHQVSFHTLPCTSPSDAAVSTVCQQLNSSLFCQSLLRRQLLKGNFTHKLHLDSILRCFEVVKLTGKTTNLTSAIGNISSEEGTVSKRRAHPIVEHSSDNHNVSVWILGLVSCRGQR